MELTTSLPQEGIKKLMQTYIILIISRTPAQIAIHRAICARLCVSQLESEWGQQTVIGIHTLSSSSAATANSGMKRLALAITQCVWPYDHSMSSCACTKHATMDNQCKVLQLENIVYCTAQRSQQSYKFLQLLHQFYFKAQSRTSQC